MFELHLGRSEEILRTLPDNSVDSVVCDPPYHLTSIVKRFGGKNAAPAQFGTDGAFARASRGFMGKEWDGGDIAFRPEFWVEVWRVLKPGGHLLAFSGSRTYHRMSVGIEDAGFEIRDQIMWLYGSGFPKSHDVSKGIDKAVGAEREIIGVRKAPGMAKSNVEHGSQNRTTYEFPQTSDKPATEAAKQWQGWGTALKPAHEPICVARKPLAGTVAENVQQYGTGALNIDGCRVDGNDGRWPANVIHDGSDEVLAGFPNAKSGGNVSGSEPSSVTDGIYGEFNGRVPFSGYSDSGSAARFFYCAKASKKDRDEGLDGFEAKAKGAADGTRTDNTLKGPTNALRPDSSTVSKNTHPTVKPTELMRYLCRLVTPPGGTVLDPFMGSGSTGKAAMLEGFRFIGIDMTPEYLDIARARIQAAADSVKAPSVTADAVERLKAMTCDGKPKQIDLFA